jgi:hypothetical protein
MSGYAGTGQAKLLRNNQQAYLFQKDTNIVGKASVAFEIERVNRSYYPWGVSFQIYFTDVNGVPSDPGTFEVDIQTSDIDQDTQYCTISSWTGGTSLNAFFAGRIELPNFYAKYIRAFVNSITNSVNTTILITR